MNLQAFALILLLNGVLSLPHGESCKFWLKRKRRKWFVNLNLKKLIPKWDAMARNESEGIVESCDDKQESHKNWVWLFEVETNRREALMSNSSIRFVCRSIEIKATKTRNGHQLHNRITLNVTKARSKKIGLPSHRQQKKRHKVNLTSSSE